MSTQSFQLTDDNFSAGTTNENPIAAENGTPPEIPDGGGTTPPEIPDGGGTTPPEIPDGGGTTPPGGGGASEDSVTLTGVLQIDSGTENYDGGTAGAILSSTTSDENVILVQNGASLTISNYTLNKTGDCSNADNSNFYAVNAVVAAKSAASIYIDNSTLISNAEGANGLFASGEGSTIYAYNCTITSAANSSRGLDATYQGTVIASKLTIDTAGDHCAALATDRGDGYISVTDSSLTTAGQGSPLIYSTGIIEVNNVTGTSTGSQIAGIEGLSTIRIKNSSLSGSEKKASEPVANGIIIYQSMSGDSTEGTATFEVSDSTLQSAISGGAMFYITNTSAVITVENTILDFDSANNYLLKAAGNDGSNGWGTAGSNGADVVFTAIDQTLAGTISVDGISSLDMYLIDSTYTGTFVLDTTYTGTGGTDLYIDADSTWIVTQDCTLQALTAASGAEIIDGSGNTVSIVTVSGDTILSGTSDITITVSSYMTENVEAVYTVKDFEIDRTAFEAMYGSTASSTARSDFNLSGRSDVVQIQDGNVFAICDAANGSYSSSGSLWGIGDWNAVKVSGDYNGDGYSDILMTHNNTDNNTTSVAVLLNQQDGTLAHDDIRGFSNDDWEYLGAADVNGDGITDILTIQTASSAGTNDRSINAWLLDSTGAYSADVRVGGINSEWSVIAMADVNGDGVENVILQHEDGCVSYWASVGDEMTTIKSVTDRTVLGTGDFDGDGTEDILWQYDGDDTLWTWTNIDQGENLTDSRIGQISELTGSWTFDSIGDYDGDGADEILWSSATDGSLAYSDVNATNFRNLIALA